MPQYDLLHIYDSGTNALTRFDFSLRSADVTLAVKATRTGIVYRNRAFGMTFDRQVPVQVELGGTQALLDALDNLVAKGAAFKRAVVSSHGSPGAISIGNERIDSSTLRRCFANKGYDRLFPLFTRMGFVGCNVADGDQGWAFLEAAANIFFKSMGGIAFGWDSAGLAIPFHSVHLWGDCRYVVAAPGGFVIDRYTEMEQFKRKFPNMSWL